jgi:hypothetical protein
MIWNDIYGDDDYDGEFSVGRRPGSGSISTVASTSELASYLDSDTITKFDEDFNAYLGGISISSLILFLLYLIKLS